MKWPQITNCLSGLPISFHHLISIIVMELKEKVHYLLSFQVQTIQAIRVSSSYGAFKKYQVFV